MPAHLVGYPAAPSLSSSRASSRDASPGMHRYQSASYSPPVKEAGPRSEGARVGTARNGKTASADAKALLTALELEREQSCKLIADQVVVLEALGCRV